ncbi:MAG: alpha/beta hydrolase-fold protein, partial [Bacteroidia bacterium]|nr:alpha/beta hydrolase-fold protein [Bacteroidia bacterium]
VTFVLDSIPTYTPAAGPIYIAGDFNGWNPGNAAQALQMNQSGQWWIALPSRAAGTKILYKFTRGSWATVEKGAGGEEISNRSYTYSVPDTVRITIFNWADHSGGETTTAAKNVTRISENFPIPQLGRTRRIWLYLPPDYESSGKSYPVLYMHDGQNVFDSYTSFAGEWNVDESLNELAGLGHEVPIVVAIDNDGAHRMDEYSPWHNASYGGGEGDLYIDFIVNTLKPYIDSAYRTRKGQESTCIMGSSMGGLISMFGAFKRPDVFGKAGIFSPSYWFSDSIWPFVRSVDKIHPMRLYQLVGSAEGGSMVPDMIAMQDTLRKFGFTDNELKSKVVTGAGHNEGFWRSEFKEAFLWLFDESSGIGSIPKSSQLLKLYPNPVQDILFVELPEPGKSVNLRIYTIAGACLAEYRHFSGTKIQIGNLTSGKYLVKISDEGWNASGWFVKE